MAIYFSEVLKQNRKARDLTQEQIAEAFNVSPQAVSRWENGATYPDIEILPSIAAYFNITVDELLGVDKMKDKERIDAIIKEVYCNWNKGQMDDALGLLREAVHEFPREYILQNLLALTLTQKTEPDKEKAKKNLSEAIAIRERILENSTDDLIRNQVLFGLSKNYKEAGNKEQAVKTALKLSDVASSSDVVLTSIYEGDDRIWQLKRNIQVFGQLLANSIAKLANSNKNLSSHERIELLNKAIGIFDLIYDKGDYGFNNFFMSSLYYRIACNFYEMNDTDNTLNCLEKAVQHAIDFDTMAVQMRHTSLSVRNIGNNSGLVKNYRYNECHRLLHGDGLAHGKFDTLREDERYKAIITKLEEYAKEY
jgi:transcriptional regulator with XRE-family HTH domain